MVNLLGGLYPGLYDLGVQPALPVWAPSETVCSSGITVRVLAEAAAINCNFLVTATGIQVTLLTTEIPPVPPEMASAGIEVRQKVTAEAVAVRGGCLCESP